LISKPAAGFSLITLAFPELPPHDANDQLGNVDVIIAFARSMNLEVDLVSLRDQARCGKACLVKIRPCSVAGRSISSATVRVRLDAGSWHTEEHVVDQMRTFGFRFAEVDVRLRAADVRPAAGGRSASAAAVRRVGASPR
jgi:hypothetical protein